MIRLTGAFDTHVHAAPSVFERPYTALDVAAAADHQAMFGIVLKHHFEPTVSIAALTQAVHPRLTVVGGVVLNRYVGGINPVAVEAAIKMGGRIVWFPTIDADNHARYFGSISSYDVAVGDGGPRIGGGTAGFPRLTDGRGIRVMDDDGKLSQAAREVVALCRDHDVVLNTGHVGPDEVFALVRLARELGLRRYMVGHVQWRPMRLDADAIAELASLGAWIEFAAATSFPIPGHTRPAEVVAALKRLAVERCILSSDAGAAVYPIAPETLRSYVQCLIDTGLPQSDAERMISENPRALFGL